MSKDLRIKFGPITRENIDQVCGMCTRLMELLCRVGVSAGAFSADVDADMLSTHI